MVNKINIFYHLYERKITLQNFVLANETHTFYKKFGQDILINNTIYCFFICGKTTITYYTNRNFFTIQ